jgi:hypothetical protein
MYMLNHLDSGLCPVHGEISGMDFIRTRGMSKVDALIEIMSEQALYEVRCMAEDARAAMRGASSSNSAEP